VFAALVFAVLGEASRAVHLRLMSNPETSVSRRSPLISSKFPARFLANFRPAKINRPNLFNPCFSAKRPKIKQFGRLISGRPGGIALIKVSHVTTYGMCRLFIPWKVAWQAH